MGGKGTQSLRTFANVVLVGEAWMLPISTGALPLQVKDPATTPDRWRSWMPGEVCNTLPPPRFYMGIKPNLLSYQNKAPHIAK